MDDLIRRQDAYNLVKQYFRENYIIDGDWYACEIIRELEDLPSAESEIIKCKDCKHFEYDHMYVIQGIPVIGHLVCNKWGNGCRTKEDGFCFMAERRTDE